jgi:hypothetical protein
MTNKRTTKIGIAVVGGTLILIGVIGIGVQAHAQEDEPGPAQCPGLEQHALCQYGGIDDNGRIYVFLSVLKNPQEKQMFCSIIRMNATDMYGIATAIGYP